MKSANLVWKDAVLHSLHLLRNGYSPLQPLWLAGNIRPIVSAPYVLNRFLALATDVIVNVTSFTSLLCRLNDAAKIRTFFELQTF